MIQYLLFRTENQYLTTVLIIAQYCTSTKNNNYALNRCALTNVLIHNNDDDDNNEDYDQHD